MRSCFALLEWGVNSYAAQISPLLQMMKLDALVPALTMGTPKAIRNNAGGILNHLIYFKVMLLPLIRLSCNTLCLFLARATSESLGHLDDVLGFCAAWLQCPLPSLNFRFALKSQIKLALVFICFLEDQGLPRCPWGGLCPTLCMLFADAHDAHCHVQHHQQHHAAL